MSLIRLAILRNEVDSDHKDWIAACGALSGRVSHDVIDLTHEDWLDRITSGGYDGLLAIPSGWTTPFKVLYDERITILDELGYRICPALKEIRVYENKKYLAYWLKAHHIPHPRTWVFYDHTEAMAFAARVQLPLVAKLSIGAGGNGVRILRSRSAVQTYIHKAFHGGGVSQRVGPKWWDRRFFRRLLEKLRDPGAVRARLTEYRHLRSEVQKDHVLFQEFIPHAYEWRVVRIGDSFFAHKKMTKGDKASGSLIKGYENPPLDLLDFVRDITNSAGFRSQAIDVFEDAQRGYLVNEMQCLFGQSDPYQMLVDGVPGRYVYKEGGWVFESGDFNSLASFRLRLEWFLDQLAINGPKGDDVPQAQEAR